MTFHTQNTKHVTALMVLMLVLPVQALLAAEAPQSAQNPRQGISVVAEVYKENCAVCHGDVLQGSPQGTALIGGDLIHGDSMPDLLHSITKGYTETGMPGWAATFTHEEIKSLALWVSESRNRLDYSDFNISTTLRIPHETIQSELHNYHIETIVEGIDPLPYSIAPLPDGRILVTEKMRGMRIVSADGKLSELIKGTPAVYDDTRANGVGLEFGMGWLQDVTLHPDYKSNGWIYLYHTDRCEDCNEISRQENRPVSMSKLIRGRIRDNEWVDEQTIWQADKSAYAPGSDVAVGGRIAFDPAGYVYIGVGMKSRDGIQDLQSPHGKIHRLHDDGKIPRDNPFVDNPNALDSIWTYGHRSPQGLEFDPLTGQLWGTEHGPRGGDEVNLLLPGRNYGWPLYSKGQNYNGTKVDWGKSAGVTYELKDIEQPVVDLTPSPAISSFIIYNGSGFPAWQNNFIVGSLKATDVYRIVIKDNKHVHTELIIENLARIRDIEIGHAGEIYLLLEHASGGQIVRVIPQDQNLADINN